MDAVEAVLGPKPEADRVQSILGPRPMEPEGPLPFVSPESESTRLYQNNPVESFIATTPTGRIMEAIGRGASTGWGENTIHLSDDVDKLAREAGLFYNGRPSWAEPLQAFNKALIMPLATTLEGVLRAGAMIPRGFSALTLGAAEGAAGVARETGLADWMGLPPERLTRDVIGLSNSILTLSGAMPFGVKPIGFTSTATPRSKVVEAGLRAERDVQGLERPMTLDEIGSVAQMLGVSTRELTAGSKPLTAAEGLAAIEGFKAEIKGIRAEAAAVAEGNATEAQALSFLQRARAVGREEPRLSLEEYGGMPAATKAARRIEALETDAQVARMLQDIRKPTFFDQFNEYFSNALRSGLSTPVGNFSASTVTSLGDALETAVQAGIGKVLGSAERIEPDALRAQLFAMANGAREGTAMAWDVLRTETPARLGTAIDLPQRQIPGIAGQIVRLPTRVDMASDALFRSIVYRRELANQAYLQAAREGLVGDARIARVQGLLDAPPPALMEQAVNHARKVNLGDPLGPLGQGFLRFADEHKSVRLVVPFVRTITNLVKYAQERTPGLNLLSKEVRENLKGKNGVYARDRELAKMFVGSSIAGTTMMLVSEDRVTGAGPSDPHERALWLQDHQPYSIRIDDTWYSYRRWTEPYGAIIGLAADMAPVWDKMTKGEQAEAASAFVLAIRKNIVEASAFRGPADLVKVMNDPTRYGENFKNNFIASLLVPSAISQFAKEDDTLRETKGLVDAIRARVPGLSTDLPAKINVFGEEIQRPEAFGSRIVNPVGEKTVVRDPIVDELRSLEVFPARPRDKVQGVKLNPEQYEELQILSGRLLKYNLNKVMNTPGYSSLPDYARKEIVQKNIDAARESGRAYLMLKHPEILGESMRLKLLMRSGVTK